MTMCWGWDPRGNLSAFPMDIGVFELLPFLGRSDAVDTVLPSPATHAILTVLKSGESVIQTFLLTKTVVHA